MDKPCENIMSERVPDNIRLVYVLEFVLHLTKDGIKETNI